MCNTIRDNKFVFEGRFRECSLCTDGKSYSHIEDCKACRGKGKIPSGSRNYKCKTCSGNGYVRLETPTLQGDCRHCKGTQKVPLERHSTISKEEKEWIFENLFNFEKEYAAGYNNFNEGYLGIGVVCGVTDYGRYISMTPQEFKEEAKQRFLEGYLQYVSLTDADQLPAEILIRKGKSGWFAYPIYANPGKKVA
jgi:RecJ-like exonuclease